MTGRGNKMKRMMTSLDNMEESDFNSYVFIQFAYIVTPNSNKTQSGFINVNNSTTIVKILNDA